MLFADFADPTAPKIEKIHADGVLPDGMTLCVTDTRASHSELTGEFAAIRNEMEAVAACLGGKVLGEVDEKHFWQELPRLREPMAATAPCCVPSTILRRMPVLAQRDALAAGDFAAFARLVEKSGHSSFECCQNVYCASSPKHQGCRRRWPSARASLQAPAVHGGCRAAALPERSRLLYRMRW